jgi:hypothetical protein
MDPDAIVEALSRLATRNYGEQGIPMLLLLENTADEVQQVSGNASGVSLYAELAVSDETLAQKAGPAFRNAVASLDGMGRELATGDLARVIEWVADERFGPKTLAVGRGDAQS